MSEESMTKFAWGHKRHLCTVAPHGGVSEAHPPLRLELEHLPTQRAHPKRFVPRGHGSGEGWHEATERMEHRREQASGEGVHGGLWAGQHQCIQIERVERLPYDAATGSVVGFVQLELRRRSFAALQTPRHRAACEEARSHCPGGGESVQRPTNQVDVCRRGRGGSGGGGEGVREGGGEE